MNNTFHKMILLNRNGLYDAELINKVDRFVRSVFNCDEPIHLSDECYYRSESTKDRLDELAKQNNMLNETALLYSMSNMFQYTYESAINAIFDETMPLEVDCYAIKTLRKNYEKSPLRHKYDFQTYVRAQRNADEEYMCRIVFGDDYPESIGFTNKGERLFSDFLDLCKNEKF